MNLPAPPTATQRQIAFNNMIDKKLQNRRRPRPDDNLRVHWYIVTNGGGHGSYDLVDHEKSLEKISGFKGGIGEGIGILTTVVEPHGFLLLRDTIHGKIRETAEQIGWKIEYITDQDFENGWMEWLKKRNGSVGADRWAISWTLCGRLNAACQASARGAVRLTLRGNHMLDSPIDQRSRMLPSRVTFSTKVQYSLQRILTLQGRLKKNRIDMLLLANPFAIAHILYLPCDPKWRSYLVIEQQRATLFTDWLHETVMKHVKSALKVTVLGYCAIYGYLSNFGKGSIGHPSNTQYSVRLSEDTSWGIHTLLSSRCRIECDAYVKEGKEAHDEYLRRNLHAWVTDTSGKLPEYNSNNVQRLSTNEQYAIHLLQDRPGFNTPYRDWPHMDQIPSFPDPGLREFTGNLIWLAALLNSPTPYTYLSLLLADSHLWIATLRKVLGILPTQGENRIYKFHSTFQFRRRAIHLLRRLCKSWDKYPEIWDVYVPGDIWLSTNTLDIQRGGYSRVSRGTMRNGRAVALKQLVNNSDLRKNILREAIVWEQADHPHIVKFLGLYSTPDSLYMVSDFIDGMQGKSWAIDKYPSPWQINHVLRQAIDALNYLHNEMGIVHCDMRADNIMVDATDRAHLIDFGLSNIRMDVNSIAHHLATTTQDLTHARWLPPEMFVPDGSGRYVFHDVTTDMWAFGCVIMELYTTTIPWAITADGGLPRKIQEEMKTNKAAYPWPLVPPNGMDARLWALTMDCWHVMPRCRVGATSALSILTRISPFVEAT